MRIPVRWAISLKMKTPPRRWIPPRARCSAGRCSSALNLLSDREREVLELRFGLKDGKDHTLEEVSRTTM
jgi:hypothetical protein